MKVANVIADLRGDHRPTDDIIADIFARDEFSGYDANDEETKCTVEEWAQVVKDYNEATHLYVMSIELIAEMVQDQISSRTAQ